MPSCFSALLPKRNQRRQDAEAVPSRSVTHRAMPDTAQAHNPHACCGSFALLEESNEKRLDDAPPAYPMSGILDDLSAIIKDKIEALSDDLRDLSLQMWDLHEIRWQEHKTHDLFVKYLSEQCQGWKVTPHAYGVETAFAAEFISKPTKAQGKLPTIGFQSELDALPGLGHACGHNLIAISGVAAALSVAEALTKHNVPGRVILLGTPAEEGGGGKINLLQAGAYKEMDACLMVHPAPFDNVARMLAVLPINVSFEGVPAHAGAVPWEGKNALDAGVLSYMSISALRQQIKTDCRVHGILQGTDWAPNVIPDNCKLEYNVRAPTAKTVQELADRVEKCFEAASMATGCKVTIERGALYADVDNCTTLNTVYRQFMKSEYDLKVDTGVWEASTDFGNVTYELPGIHALYQIPLGDPHKNGNHTSGFTKAARTPEAHEATLKAATGIAVIGAKVLVDDKFREETWKAWKDARGKSEK